jgi:hypothetical protein
MNRFGRFARTVLASGLVLMGLGTGTRGMAEPPTPLGKLDAQLRGTYVFSGIRVCTVSSLDFVGPTLAIPAGPPTTFFRASTADAGTITFNGDGTGSLLLRSRTMNMDSTVGSPLSLSDVSGTLVYTVTSDGYVDFEVPSASFEVVFGSTVGNTGTITGTVRRLQIMNGNVLVTAPSGTPQSERIDITTPQGASFTQYRICLTSGTAAKTSVP